MVKLSYYLRISNHLAGQLDIRSALRSVKSEIEHILPLDHLDVCLIEEDNLWNTSYEVGLRTGWDSSKGLIAHSPVRDILTGKTDFMITGNAMEDERYIFPGALSEPILRHQLKSRVNVSMKLLGRTIGSLNCSSVKPDLYNTETVKEVRNIADVLAPYFYALQATENAKREAVARAEMQAREEGLRLGALSLTEALERERQRIGMDLHDQTLADLTRIARDMTRQLDQEDVQQIQVRLQDCIQGLRDIIDTSIPSLLELFGFQHAVRTHIERAIMSAPDMHFTIIDQSASAIDRLPEITRVALFRIAQEAVNNSVQHSGATELKVTVMDGEDGKLTLSISDNGKGLNAARSRKNTGGLTHMQTRARLIGAEFELLEQPGTEIRVHLIRENITQKAEGISEDIIG